MTSPLPGDPTLWELHRALHQLREDQSSGIKQLRDDLRADWAALAARLEQVVTKEVYAADQRALLLRLQAMEDEQAEAARLRDRAHQQQASTRKWLVSAFLAPILLGAVQLWLASRIGSSP